MLILAQKFKYIFVEEIDRNNSNIFLILGGKIQIILTVI